MLVMSRKKQQCLIVESPAGFEHFIKITILAVRNGKVTLGVDVEDDPRIAKLDGTKDRPSNGRSHTVPFHLSMANADIDRWEDDGGWAAIPSRHDPARSP